MFTLAALTGTGAARIPRDSYSPSLVLSPHAQRQILTTVWQTHYAEYAAYDRALHAMQTDPQAARYIRDAAVAYCATPAAPAAALPPPRRFRRCTTTHH